MVTTLSSSSSTAAPPPAALRGNSDDHGDAATKVTHAVRDDELDDFSLSSDDENGGAGGGSGTESLDRAMMNELLLVCSNLGMLRVVKEGDAPVLMRGEDCVEWVHDLQRVIRRDHAKHKLVAKQLGKWKILEKKLLPLLVNHQHDWTLVFSILKVLVMLTMKPPRDSTNIAQQLTYLRAYKHAFLREGVVPILMTILVEPLAKKGSARSDQDYLSMELVLTLLRNLLAIPNEDARFVTSSSSHLSHLQQDLIHTLHEENVYEMVLLFAQDIDSSENREWNLLIMEMLDLTLGCSTPKAIAAFLKQQLNDAVTQEPQQPVQTQSLTQTPTLNPTPPSARPPSYGESSLLNALTSEKKLAKPRKPLGSQRHSNFGGMMKLVGSTGHSTVLTSFSKLGDEQVPQAVKKPVARKRGGRGSSSQPSITQTMDVIEIFAPKQSVTESDHVTMTILVELCDTVLDKSYFQLTNSLKGEFRRGSSKLVSTDRLQYFHLIWFITTYHRLKMQALKSIHRHNLKAYEKEKQALMAALDFDTPPPNEPTAPDLNEKAVLSTLDMFSFNFVLQSIETYATGKNYHGMTVSVKLLAEMMAYLSELANSDDVRFQRIADSLQHKIFYERDFLDRLPVLLKTWSPGTFAMDYVMDVITLTHIVFKILDSQGTIKVLSRRKAQLAETRKQKKKKNTDGAEGGDGDDDDDDDSGDEEEAERRAQLLLEMQRKEADFDVRRYFQSILSFETIKMYCQALTDYRTNSAKVNHYIHSFFYRAKHFRIHKDDEWTLQPMLFNIHVLLLFNKMLQDPLMHKHEYKGFLDFIRGVVRDFFTLADKNRLLFVETLLRQPYAAKSCLLMQRNYEASDGMTRSRAEAVALGRQEKLDRISEARRQKKALDAEDLDGEAEFTFTLNSTDFQSSSLVTSSQNGKSAQRTSTAERMQDEDDDEGGAEFDGGAIAPSPAASRPKRRSQAATERAKNWTKIEDRFLKKVYVQYRHLPSVYEVISYEDMFQDRDRTPEQIERRVKHLKLHRSTHDSSEDEEDEDHAKGSSDNRPAENDDDGIAFNNDTTMEGARLPKGLAMDDADNSDDNAGATSQLTRRRRLRRAAAEDDDDSEDDLFSNGALGSARRVAAADSDTIMADASESIDTTMGDTLEFPDSTPTYLTYDIVPPAAVQDVGNDVTMPLAAPSPHGADEEHDEEHDDAGESAALSENHRKRPREDMEDQDDEADATGSVGSPSKKIAREEAVAVAEAEEDMEPLTEAMEETQVIDDVVEEKQEAEL